MHLLRLLPILLACVLPAVAAAAEIDRHENGQPVYKSHAIAMHGEAKYARDFEHFDYVNPEAPKTGALVMGDQGNWDSFNQYLIRGSSAPGIGLIQESLMTNSRDEPFTLYGWIAETVEWPEDRSWVIFNLRPEARWHDGEPITAEDVVWTFNALREASPNFRFYYSSVSGAEKLGERRVKFSFSDGENRELPLIVGQMDVLPKHYWEEREFKETTLEPPLGSGPYRIADFEPAREITYERVDDYWADDLPSRKGEWNFQEVVYKTFFDPNVIREAVKGGVIDLRVENQAKAWALDYNVAALEQGWMLKEEIEHDRPAGMQGFFMNTRRPIFSDPRVRRAMSYAFDFEWTNRNLFFGQYARTESYFANSELASEGLPTGREREILETYRDRLKPEVFNEAYIAPSTDGSGWPRENLLKALGLLREAGWVIEDMKLVDGETGAPFFFEILIVSPAFERIMLPYIRNLKRLGIEVRLRLVDSSQYINRLRSFDFDMIVGTIGQSSSPGNEQRFYWTTQAASEPGSRNFSGVSDPVVDELVEMVIAAPDREELVARTRALDRVLLWGHYVVPNWHATVDRYIYWDKFDRPEITPDNGTSVSLWWWDSDRARAVAERQRGQLNERGGDGG